MMPVKTAAVLMMVAVLEELDLFDGVLEELDSFDGCADEDGSSGYGCWMEDGELDGMEWYCEEEEETE
jgi:hypothetical protein